MDAIERFCEPHLRRTGERVQATRTVNGEPMCDACFRGKPIHALEEEIRIGLPFFLADALNAKRMQAQPHGQGVARGKMV